MPTLMELQKRLKTPLVVRHSLGSEEVLISDVRAQMRPGDFIAQKLQAAMVNGSAVASPAKSGKLHPQLNQRLLDGRKDAGSA